MLTSLLAILEDVFPAATFARRAIAFWTPVAPIPTVLGPFLALGSLIALALLSGLAASSLATLLIALVMLYLFLTEVLGLSLELTLR